MADRNSETYKPGPDSTKKIIDTIEKGIRNGSGRKGVPVVGTETDYINPFLITVGTLARGILRGGAALEVKKRGVALDHFVGEHKDKVGTKWTVFDHDPSSATIILEGFNLVDDSRVGRFNRWMNPETRMFIRDLTKGLKTLSEAVWGNQVEVFPKAAYETFFTEKDSEALEWAKWKREGIERFDLVDFNTPRTTDQMGSFFAYLAGEPTVSGWGQEKTVDKMAKDLEEGLGIDKSLVVKAEDIFERVTGKDRHVWGDVAVEMMGNNSRFRAHLAKAIFLTPVIGINGNTEGKDGVEALLSVTTFWRNAFLSSFVLPEVGNEDIQKKFLEVVDPLEAQAFFDICPKLIYEQTRKAREGGDAGLGSIDEEMTKYFRASRGGDMHILGGRHEVGYVAAVEKFNPTIKARIRELGFEEKYSGLFSIFDEGYPEDWNEVSAKAISMYIDETNHRGIANFGDSKRDQIDLVSKRIWDKVRKGGVHFVQSGDQISTVIFDRGSLATRAGLAGVHFRNSSLVEGRVNIMLQYTDSDVPSVSGFIDPNGELILRSSLAAKEPGYHAILRNVAVASFYDLARQETAPEVKTYKKDQAKEDGENNKTPQLRPTDRVSITRIGRRKRRDSRSVQSDERTDSEFTTRHVEGHPTLLKHAGEISYWVKEYLKAVTATPISERAEISNVYRAFIEEADEDAYKISPEKANNIPFGMKLGAEIVPFLNNEGVFPLRTLETWTIPHVSPALTDEERASLPASFEKRFRGDGSHWLQWLEYMYLEQIR